MKAERIISIKHPLLKNLRNNLRIVISQAYDNKMRFYSQKDANLIKNVNSLKSLTDKEISEFTNLMEDLSDKFEGSVCCCPRCGSRNMDVVYSLRWKNWYCVKCYIKEMKRLDPKEWFNKGVIVRDDVFKPCSELKYCPYGNLVEAFMMHGTSNETLCGTFGHDCPAFYLAHNIYEGSGKCPPLVSPKLKDNLRSVKCFNDKERINSENLPKPCHALLWCPYGSLGDEYNPRSSGTYSCRLYHHNCPAFYHAERITEDFDSYPLHDSILEKSSKIVKDYESYPNDEKLLQVSKENSSFFDLLFKSK